MPDTAILVMAYGTPRGIEDLAGYYTHIRRGIPPSEDLLRDLADRYRAIGGRSPLADVTEAQARGLEERVEGARSFVGMKHSDPFIEDAVEAVARSGIGRAVGLVMAPHYSAMSVGEYARRARAAAGDRVEIDTIDSWHLDPGFVAWTAREVRASLDRVGEEAVVVFSAHSLPERILATGDPYASQLEDTARAVAAAAGLERWRTAWQSAGRTDEAWLGPDLLDVVDELAASGATAIVSCPCGFVSDHLEVLYDVDVEAAGRARERGLAFARTRAPNADPAFLDALAGVVRTHLASR